MYGIEPRFKPLSVNCVKKFNVELLVNINSELLSKCFSFISNMAAV